jgi:predicted amidohydrolase
MNSLAVSIAQFELAPDADFDAFGSRVEAVAREAVADGSRLVLLPELITTSLLAARPDREDLTVADLNRVYREHFPLYTDRLIELYQDLSAATGIAIAGGSHLRSVDGELRNTAVVALPDGSIVLQDKLHLTPAERSMGVVPGDDVTVFEVDGMPMAVQICADIEFPEVPRILARRGVEAILCPSLTWNTRGSERVRIGAHARAMENQIFVLVSPLVASSGYPKEGGIHGTGNARVTVPLDRVFGQNDGVLAEAEDTRRSALLHTVLDRDLLERSRENPEPPGFRYVRDDLYERLRGGRP